MRLPVHKVMTRADSEKVRALQVAVISGGGSRPVTAHAGYIGAGMFLRWIDRSSVFDIVRPTRFAVSL
jgi:dihydroxyacetone kinase